MNALVVENISKTYDDFQAVKSVSFELQEGKLFGLLGPNGAGKTTTMRMIMNIIVPDSGNIYLFGEKFNELHKNQVGYLPEERGLYPKMKLMDHLQFLGEMKGMSPKDAKTIGLRWMDRFGMLDRAKRKVSELSKGLQQKIQFISTIMHEPKLIIMDEPFSGLDPVNAKFLKDILLELKASGTTIILSTHLMDQAEKLCDEICLISNGQIVLQGDIKKVKKDHSLNNVIVEYSGNGDFIKSLPMVKTSDDYGNYIDVQLHDDRSPGELFKELASADLDVRRFEATEASLNQIFIDIVEKK